MAIQSQGPLSPIAATLFILVGAAAIASCGWAGPPNDATTVRLTPTPATQAARATPTQRATAPTTSQPQPSLVGRGIAVVAPEVSLRSEPDGDELAVLRSGQRMRLLDGPVVVRGMEWYGVRIGPGDVRGWVPAGPDGEWLALVEDGAIVASCAGDQCPDGSGVYLATLEDGLGTKVADEPMWLGVWSPDGTRLMVTDAPASPGTALLLAPDGAPLGERLAVDDVPAWSPDGSRLAWSTGDSLVVTDADLAVTELVRMDATVRSPAWSPDGTRLAFIQRPCPECDRSGIARPPGTVWMVDVDGGNLTPLGSASSDSVHWPADGRYLALSEYDDPTARGAELSLLSIEDGARTAAIAEGLVPGWAMWSPDGTMVAYTTSEGLVVAEGDGSNPRLLVPAAETIPQLRWAPSGRALVIEHAPPGGGVSFAVVDVETGQSRDVLPGAPYLAVILWQPVLVPLP